MKYIKLIFLLLLPTLLFSQEVDDNYIEDLKKRFKLSEINEIDGEYSIVKKRNKYGIMRMVPEEIVIPIKFDSILFDDYASEAYIIWKKSKVGFYKPNDSVYYKPQFSNIGLLEDQEMFLIRKKNKIGWYNFYHNKMVFEPIYDTIYFEEYLETIILIKDDKMGASYTNKKILDIVYDTIYIDYNNENYYLTKNGKHGIYNVYDTKFIFDPIYDSLKIVDEELFDIEGNDYYGYYQVYEKGEKKYFSIDNPKEEIITEGYSSINKKRISYLKADSLVEDKGNGDGVFKAKIEAIQKWGLYQNYDTIYEILIPAQYDSLLFYGWNAPYTIVSNNGKYGVYTSNSIKDSSYCTTTCIFDEYKRVTDSRGKYYFAGKLGNKWYWYDWYTGIKTRDFGYDSYEDMKLYPIDTSSYYK